MSDQPKFSSDHLDPEALQSRIVAAIDKGKAIIMLEIDPRTGEFQIVTNVLDTGGCISMGLVCLREAAYAVMGVNLEGARSPEGVKSLADAAIDKAKKGPLH